jgi:hypothetical protein
MKYIKKFEDINESLFKSKDEWKVGDIIVATKNMYDRSTRWIIKDHKYKITEIEKNDPPLKDRMLLTDMNGDDYDYHYHYFKDDFIDLEQWEILNNIDKYNL